MLDTVTITISGQILTCRTPYHPDFPVAARDLGGRWKEPAWVFDARDERRVRDLCLDFFGTDGTPCELVTLRIVLSASVVDRAGKNTEIYIAGRRCAWVFNRDDHRARLGDGVIISAGRIHADGSRRDPVVGWERGTTIEVRDVPLSMAQQVQARSPEQVEIMASPVSPSPEDVQVSHDVLTLMNERSALLKRLAEVDAALLAAVPKKRETPVYEVSSDLLDHD